MLRPMLCSVCLVLILNSGGVTAPPAGVPRELLEKRLDAARTVFRLNAARLRETQTTPTEVFGWSERWLDAELALADKPADRSKALHEHVERTRELERVAQNLVK